MNVVDGGGDGQASDLLLQFLQAVSDRPLLTFAETQAIASSIEAGDASAKQAMLESDLRHVVSVAKFYRNLGLSFPHLISSGVLGLAFELDYLWTPVDREDFFQEIELAIERGILVGLARSVDGEGVTFPDDVEAFIGDLTDVVPSSHAVFRTSGRDPDATAREWATIVSQSDVLGRLHQMVVGKPCRNALLPKAADGDSEAAFQIGCILLHGARDSAAAAQWLQRAAAAGNPAAFSVLAELAVANDDEGTARGLWEQADSMMSASGQGAVTPSEAMRTWHVAHSDVLIQLGLLANKRNDERAALAYWERAAEMGDSGAFNALIEQGHRCFQDGLVDQAIEWWLPAARNGHRAASLLLGCAAFEAGDSSSAMSWWDHDEALRGAWHSVVDADASNDLLVYRAALETGVVHRDPKHDYDDAAYLLGDIQYQGGRIDNAQYWWTKAARNGDDKPQRALDLIARGASESNDDG